MKRTGRPPVLDESKRKQICALLAVGSTRIVAARCVGCAVSTIRRTAARDPAFREALRHAESLHEIGQLKNIQAASSKSWRAAAWSLERRYPGRYLRTRLKALSHAQVERLLQQFAEIVGEGVSTVRDRERVLAGLDALTGDLKPGSARASRRAPRKRERS